MMVLAKLKIQFEKDSSRAAGSSDQRVAEIGKIKYVSRAARLKEDFIANAGHLSNYLNESINHLTCDLYSVELRKKTIQFWKVKTFGLIEEVRSCSESSEFERMVNELEFDIQNIIEIIDKRLSNEKHLAKESITIKAEKLPKLPKIKIPTVGSLSRSS